MRNIIAVLLLSACICGCVKHNDSPNTLGPSIQPTSTPVSGSQLFINNSTNQSLNVWIDSAVNPILIAAGSSCSTPYSLPNGVAPGSHSVIIMSSVAYQVGFFINGSGPIGNANVNVITSSASPHGVNIACNGPGSSYVYYATVTTY